MIPAKLTKEYKRGTVVLLDGVFEVKVISQTPKRHFTKVKGIKKFTVMTYRLTEKTTAP